MALTDTLKLIITGDSTSAQAAFKKAGATAKESMGQASTGADKINTALSVLGPAAIAAGAATVAFGQKSINTYKDVGTEVLKVQRYTGATAEEASKLRFAAQQSGVGVDQLSVALGKASKALETSPEKFEKYGIATQDANGNTLSLNDILLNTADVFERMPNGAEKTAIALQLFGKSGMDVVPFLNRGRAGIEDLEKQTDKYGQLLSGRNLQDIKNSKAAQRELTAAVQGLQVELGKRLLPAVTDSTKALAGMANILTQIPDTFDRVNESSSGWYSKWLKASPGIVGHALLAKDLSDKIFNVGKSSDDTAASTEDLAAATQKAEEATAAAKDQILTFKERLDYTNDSLKESQDELDAATQKLNQWFDTIQGRLDLESQYQASIDDLTQSIKDNGTETDLSTEKGRNNLKAIEDVRQAILDKAKAHADETNSVQAGIDMANLYTIGLYNQLRQLGFTKKAAKEYIDQLGLTQPSIETAFIQSGLQEGMDDVAHYTGQLDSLNGKEITIKVLTKILGDVRPGALNAELQGRASGGPVQRGQSYIVGEHRPEVFTPTQNGYIHPSVNAGNVTVFVGGEQVSAVVTNSQRYDARGRR